MLVTNSTSTLTNALKRKKDLRDLPLPLPAAGEAAYVRERELALSTFQEKKANYDQYLRSKRTSKVEYLPIKLDIENVSRCNFHCKMCVVSDWPKNMRTMDLSLSEFQKLIDEQYGLLEIKLQGIGEPLMQGDDFIEMIRYARKKHIWVRSTTNASLLHLHDNYKKVIDADINELQISIDAADKSTFETIRAGSVFERVLGNSRLINQYCDKNNVVRTKMWTVVQQSNYRQLPELVDLAEELGFKSLVFSLNMSDWGLASWSKKNQDIDVQDQLDPERLFSLMHLGEKRGVTVRFWNVTAKYRLGNLDTLCPWPFERAYIGSDFRVSPCCYIGNPDVFQIGPKMGEHDSFYDVWHSKEFEDFRAQHLEGNLPGICKGCYDPTVNQGVM